MFKSRFLEIDSIKAKEIKSRFGSPVYLIDEQGIRKRLLEFQHYSSEFYPQSVIAVSYKTAPMHGLLSLLHKDGAWAEVVSGDEYRVARSLSVPHEKIIFNGPMKTDPDLSEAVRSGAQVNCDHFDEIIRIEELARKNRMVAAIGLRLSFPDIQNSSRFGFLVSSKIPGNAYDVLTHISKSSHLEIAGIHAHAGTNIRTLKRFGDLSERLRKFAEFLLDSFDITLRWINVGGGLAGMAPRIEDGNDEPNALINLNEYCNSVISPLIPYLDNVKQKTTVFFEPGRTLFEPFGGILVDVIGRTSANSGIVSGAIVNAGTNAIALSAEYIYPIHVCDPSGDIQAQRLYGPLCKERDIVRGSVSVPVLKPGDQLVIYGCGGYSMSQANSFIHFRHGVVIWRSNGEFQWLRKPETLDHVKRLECIPD